MRQRRWCVMPLLLLWAGAAGADAEIQRKIAALRALTLPGAARAPFALPEQGGGATCSPSRARQLDPTQTTLVTLRAVHDASLRFGVAAELIRSVIRHESAGDPAAVSHKGAIGLMQLMPETARELGVRCAFDPRENIMGGTRYLRAMRDRFGTWRHALAAYNAGPAWVESGRQLPQETRSYVEQVLRSWHGHAG